MRLSQSAILHTVAIQAKRKHFSSSSALGGRSPPLPFKDSDLVFPQCLVLTQRLPPWEEKWERCLKMAPKPQGQPQELLTHRHTRLSTGRLPGTDGA